MTQQITRRELFALHFALRLMQAKPNKFDKKKFEVGCDFGTAVNMADGLCQAIDDIPEAVHIKDPDAAA